MKPVRLNIGSGQRRFDTKQGWFNIDVHYRPGQKPDIQADGKNLPIRQMTADIVVLHHVLEHFGCGEADDLIKTCWDVLQPGGSLLIFVPDSRALAQRYVMRQIDSYTYNVNTHGAFQGEEEDRHRWSYDFASLQELLNTMLWKNYRLEGTVKFFDWREIPGADIARDWWILGMEAVKE